MKGPAKVACYSVGQSSITLVVAVFLTPARRIEAGQIMNSSIQNSPTELKPEAASKQTPMARQFLALPQETREKIDKAALRYIRRKNRAEHPAGKFDSAKRWYPNPCEGLDVSNFRSPSHAFPFSYLLACRTAAHCARLEGVGEFAKLVVLRSRMLALLPTSGDKL